MTTYKRSHSAASECNVRNEHYQLKFYAPSLTDFHLMCRKHLKRKYLFRKKNACFHPKAFYLEL